MNLPSSTLSGGSRDAIVEALYELFRTKGYEGVSIGDVSVATGLGRSSLYHHFPGGKEEMAQAVLGYTRASLKRSVFEPLAQSGGIESRVDTMLAAITSLYSGGELPCVIASLMIGTSSSPLSEEASQILREWIGAIANALTGGGVEHPEALASATAALGQIQGAIVLTRALKNPEIFSRAIAASRKILMNTLDPRNIGRSSRRD